jgi:queuine tRNA-ribosyltransferase
MAALSFQLQATDGPARAGMLRLPHGDVPTPIFMPVGTQATVKAVLPRDVADIGAKIILANTYHLLLRPGPDTVARAGGLHKFMGWDRPMLTDSGGFQVFSLAEISKIDDEGVRFTSHIDGSKVMLTPERSIEVQEALGADIIMAFDECPANPATPEAARRAVERTILWARRCVAAKKREDQSLFGIQQGGLDAALRRECTERLVEIGFPGYAVGGLAVGEEREAMRDCLSHAAPALPADRPRYLMGVGTPADILDAIGRGIDMFDCVMPTRNARNTSVFHKVEGRLNLRNARFKEDFTPVEEGCDCLCCTRFTRAYLRHLFNADEMLAATLATIHNLRFYLRLVEGAREAILAGRFAEYARNYTTETIG